MALLSKQARQNQALAEIDSLMRELKDWNESWTVRDRHENGMPRGQYKTQLDCIYTEVNATAVLVRRGLQEMSLSSDAASVYGAFARAEREVLWLWRVFYYFRDKFQQRQDQRFAETLKAADEVVWSCHRPFFQLLDQRVIRMPAPLPYIKPDFSPSALRRDQGRALGNKDSDFLLVREAFKELPVPILALPITTINNPWVLVLVGHEAGHIIEPLLEEGFNETFRELLAATIKQAGGPEEDQGVWRDWGDEIFADLYGVLTMGPWAVWAMSQFEAAEDGTMSERRISYPAACVRLRLMAEVAQRYGLQAEIPSSPYTLPEEVGRDMHYVNAIANTITGMPQVVALAKALQFDCFFYAVKDGNGHFGVVEQWSRYLSGSGAQPVTKQVQSARMATAAVAKTWSEMIFVEDSPDRRGQLRDRALAAIANAGPLDVRSSSISRSRVEPGKSLLAALRRAEFSIEEADANSS